MWLDWQAPLLDTPHWWAELTAIPEVDDPKKLAWKICTYFLIPVQSGVRPSQAKITPRSLLPNVSPGVDSSPMTLLIRMSRWQPLLLTVAYAWSAAILGRESQTANTQWLLPFGDEHSGIKAACGGACHFQQARCLPESREYYPWSQKPGTQGIPQGDPITPPITTDVRVHGAKPYGSPGGR